MIVNPGEKGKEDDDRDRVDVTFSDHPLNINPDSLWAAYFKDNEVLLQIDKDVRYSKKYLYTCKFKINALFYLIRDVPKKMEKTLFMLFLWQQILEGWNKKSILLTKI